MNLIWTDEAIRDRDEIFNYFEKKNPSVAFSLDADFSKKSSLLSDNPYLGRAGKIPHTRELIYKNYIFVYALSGENIYVLRLLHSARQWPQKK